MTYTLDEQFERLARQLRQTISLLDATHDCYWANFLQRGLKQVDLRRLSGATFVLGCYGGENTFSDVTIAHQFEHSDPLQFSNANARLHALRNDMFETANAIASRKHW